MNAFISQNLQNIKEFRLRKTDWTDWTALIVIVVTGIFSLVFADAEFASRRWLVIPALLLFTLLHVWPDNGWYDGWRLHLRIGLMTATACMMFWTTGENFGGMLLFFILSATVALSYPPQSAYKWIMLFGILTILACFWVWQVFWPALLFGISASGGYLFFAGAANAQRRAEEAQEKSQQLLEELQEAYQKLEEQASQAEELAASEERNRLAREVHDTLGHRLTVAAVQLEGAQRLAHTDPDKVVTIVTTVREQVLDGLSELRRTVATLRAPLEADLSLPHALTRLTTNFQEATGVNTYLHVEDDIPQISDHKRHAVYRAAQESLTNIQRHANASHAWVRLERQNGSIILAVSDDGIGVPTGKVTPGKVTPGEVTAAKVTPEEVTAGFGLRGLKERANQVGGSVDISHRTEGGTAVSFAVPLDEI